MNSPTSRHHFHLHADECAFGSPPDLDHGLSMTVSRSGDRSRLCIALGITSIVMILEFTAGWMANSLALIGDAGHMLTDVLAVGVSLLALHSASRPPTQRNTFGYHRMEILAALFNGVALGLLTLWILLEATDRLAHPKPVSGNIMVGIGLLGLIANISAALVLGIRSGPKTQGRRMSLNVRGAAIHILGDALSSVGVIAAGVVIIVTGWTPIDPLLSILLCGVILYSAYGLIRDSVDILLEATPRRIDGAELIETLKIIREVEDVHDVHIWTLTSGLHAFSAHIAIRDVPVSQTSRILKKINFVLCQQHGIGHTAIQFETRDADAPV